MFKIKLYSRRLIKGKILKICMCSLLSAVLFILAGVSLFFGVMSLIYGANTVFENYPFFVLTGSAEGFYGAVPFLLLLAAVIFIIGAFSAEACSEAVFYCAALKNNKSPKDFFGLKYGYKYMLLSILLFCIKIVFYAVFSAPSILCLFLLLAFINAGINSLYTAVSAVIIAVMLIIGLLAAYFISKGINLSYGCFFENSSQKTVTMIKTGLKCAKGNYLKLFRAEISYIPWKLLCVFIVPIPFVYSFIGQTSALTHVVIANKSNNHCKNTE